MKKKIIIILCVVLIIIVMGIVLLLLNSDNSELSYTEDEIKFKDEYESLNGYELTDNYILKNVEINADNNVKYVSDDEILNLLENGTNVIYLGWADCNWCRSIVPILTKVLKEENINILYYYDFKSLRNSYENNIEEEKVQLYEAIIDIIGEDIESVFDENSSRNGEKKILAPTVIFIKNGEYLGLHVKSVDSHETPTDELTNSQIAELKKIYKEFINNMNMYMCNDEGC